LYFIYNICIHINSYDLLYVLIYLTLFILCGKLYLVATTA